MQNKQNNMQKMKAELMMEEVRALIPQYKNDLYELAKIVKVKYGFWPTLYYDENKEVIVSYNYDELKEKFDLH